MDSDEDILDEDCFCLDSESLNGSDYLEYYEDFKYDVLSTEDVVEDMLNLIKEVNTIVQVHIFFFYWFYESRFLYFGAFGYEFDNCCNLRYFCIISFFNLIYKWVKFFP